LTDCAFSNNFLRIYLSTWLSPFGDVPEFLPTKQPFWDRPSVLVDKALVEASLNSPHSRASFLAASSQHNGDWLFALSIASCGLKLDDEMRLAWGSGWICASRMSVTAAALWLTPVWFTALSARKPPTGQLDIMPWTTWMLGALPLLVSLSVMSQRDCSGQTESDLMVLHLSHVRVARHYVGASQ